MSDRELLFHSVLFVCTRNAVRSPMAEALVNSIAPKDEVRVVSAGLEAAPLEPFAVEVMKEIGIDMSGHQPTSLLDALLSDKFDLIVTLSDEAAAKVLPREGQRVANWSVPDPSRCEGSREQALNAYREVRDTLKHRVETLFEGL